MFIKGCNTILQNSQEQIFVSPRFSKGKSGTFRGDQEKIKLNFHDSWFLTLEFLRCVTQFYKGKEKFVLSRFPKGKVTKLKDARFLFKKVSPQYPLFGFSWNSPTIISYVIVIVQILTNRWNFKFNTEN